MLDESPLIDIKPFVPAFDNRLNASSGWLSRSLKDKQYTHKSDERFEE
jgi:tRNA (Thr-GGU) A37 N-methylase